MASGFITSRSRGPQLDVRNKSSVNDFFVRPRTGLPIDSEQGIFHVLHHTSSSGNRGWLHLLRAARRSPPAPCFHHHLLCRALSFSSPPETEPSEITRGVTVWGNVDPIAQADGEHKKFGKVSLLWMDCLFHLWAFVLALPEDHVQDNWTCVVFLQAKHPDEAHCVVWLTERHRCVNLRNVFENQNLFKNLYRLFKK